MRGQIQKRVLPFSAEQLYKLVADVKRYPEFLPWCAEAHVHKETPEEMLADLTIGYSFFSETFTSHVYLKPHESIDVECVKGPFDKMVNHWKFYPLNDHETEVEFSIDYQFKNPLFQMAMDKIYDTAFMKMTEAFEERAVEIYGVPKTAAG